MMMLLLGWRQDLLLLLLLLLRVRLQLHVLHGGLLMELR
jgi:hypothetical protein